MATLELAGIPRPAPRIPVHLDWGRSWCAAEAVCFTEERALVLTAGPLQTGLMLQVENMRTGNVARFRVAWCSESDGLGRYRLGLLMIDQRSTFWALA